MFIDHKNHNKIDNRIANLRDVTKAENAWNTSKSPRGTIFHRVNKRWLALIRKNGKVKYLGSFKTEEEAHQHYLSMKPLYHSIPVRSGSPKNQNSLKFQNNAP